jgi:uncharacterized protein YjbI with pentapeptide repeats
VDEDLKDLLSDVNSASQHVAVLHVAFMAVCAYVLVIVFGTTDRDLLIGKWVRLPVVDVEVSLLVFYAAAPILVLLVHSNLLLQLQLLSRKLYILQRVASEEGKTRNINWRDRLYLFLYTYYLVGRPNRIVDFLVGVIVLITFVLLPLVVLFSLQLWFLAYQDETITWFHRIFIWIDAVLLALLWPISLHPRGEHKDYWRKFFKAYFPGKGKSKCFFLFLPFLGILFMLLSAAPFMFWIGCGLFSLTWALILLHLYIRKLSLKAPRGSIALLVILPLAFFLPLALMVDGEKIEGIVHRFHDYIVPGSVPDGEGTLLSRLIPEMRRLDLDQQILLLRLPSHEILSKIRSERWGEAIGSIEPINLQNRSLKNAQMSRAVLVGVDLSSAKLQGANLRYAYLQGANLEDAKLQGTDLEHADLQGSKLGKSPFRGAIVKSIRLKDTDMRDIQLQGIDLEKAQLQGADLSGANLQGARLKYAQLQDAKLKKAQLQCSLLEHAKLQGADLQGAQLQGANLWRAQLQSANLRAAALQGADLTFASLRGTDLESAQLQGAQLLETILEGSNLRGAQLQGTILREAALGGADLKGAKLQGVDLREAKIRGVEFREATLYDLATNPNTALRRLSDLRGVKLEPLKEKEVSTLIQELKAIIGNPERLDEIIMRLNEATQPGKLLPRYQSCLARKNDPDICDTRFDPNDPKEKQSYIKELHPFLSNIFCQSADNARGILRQIVEADADSTRKGLASQLIEKEECAGLKGLSEKEKEELIQANRKEKKTSSDIKD